jgi:hypothetical protein
MGSKASVDILQQDGARGVGSIKKLGGPRFRGALLE